MEDSFSILIPTILMMLCFLCGWFGATTRIFRRSQDLILVVPLSKVNAVINALQKADDNPENLDLAIERVRLAKMNQPIDQTKKPEFAEVANNLFSSFANVMKNLSEPVQSNPISYGGSIRVNQNSDMDMGDSFRISSSSKKE
jgi:hypothetical protein